MQKNAFQCLQSIWNKFLSHFKKLPDFFSFSRYLKNLILWANLDYNIQSGYRLRWWKLLFGKSKTTYLILKPLPLFVLELQNILLGSQFRQFFHFYKSQTLHNHDANKANSWLPTENILHLLSEHTTSFYSRNFLHLRNNNSFINPTSHGRFWATPYNGTLCSLPPYFLSMFY